MVSSPALVTANLGSFEKPVEHGTQALEYTHYHFTDENFPPRINMSSRLQARIPKMFWWQLRPGHDIYIWLDNSCRLKVDAIPKLIMELDCNDMLVFEHPDRETLQEEADFIKGRMELERQGKKKPYLLPRYENESVDEQMEQVGDGPLFATTLFVARNTSAVERVMRDWWLHTSRYHTVDQLSFTHAIKNIHYKVMDKNKDEYIEYVR